ncbi:beta glucosidase precursor [Exidia glandulosa HHB12029]|uniref:beta-glucosidase n=1 Tax=Exidia glandulosa HHB12029 TaxID=1314781 RepID=A0A165ESE1_EXIGL|nr:beta glucosidase precursor [Exidia glandulosa HHB12029]
MLSTGLLTLALALSVARADIQAGVPYPAPAGFEEWTSPIVVPSPPTTGAADWAAAVAKAKKFVSGLTLLEKVNVTTGIGSNSRCLGNTGAITRLGFPGFCLHDSPLGVRLADLVSAFPAAINVASTWDPDLFYARGKAMGEEFRGKGINVALGPMTNLGRVAAGGRNWEGFGVDPYLSGIATAETVKGIQDVGVIACAKHFIANEQEHFRGGSLSEAYSSNLDDRTLHEVYAWPFANAVQAGVGSVMCSYNRINQTFACENSKLINGIMKTELNFQGFLVSDWAAMLDGVNSALAGTDMDMPGFRAYGQDPDLPDPSLSDNGFWGKFLVDAVNNGSVSTARLDDMVTRSFAAYFKLGQDKGYPKTNFDVTTPDDFRNGVLVNEHVNVQGNHKAVIREIGAASVVLLKNKGGLPLSTKKAGRIGIFGSDAGPHPAGPNGCINGQGDHGCNDGTLAQGWGSGTANFPYLIDPLAAITNFVAEQGDGNTVEAVLSEWDFGKVDAIGRYADTCLVFSNADSGEGYITVDGNQGDRNNLTLWNSGETLIKRAAGACDNTIVVLHTVGPVLVEDWIDHPNITAVVWAGLPGQETGNSLVDVLFGKVNPSGRLPFTVAKSRADYNADVVYSNPGNLQITYTEGLNIDYRHFDAANITPRFEFGFGLSYTDFKYSGLSARVSIPKREEPSTSAKTGHSTPAVVPPGGPADHWKSAVKVSFTIKNVGKVDGHEVPQVYLSYPASAGEPPKVLRGFARPLIKKGQSKTLTLELLKRDISIWDVVSQSWVVPKGRYTVAVGASSRDIRQSTTFTV